MASSEKDAKRAINPSERARSSAEIDIEDIEIKENLVEFNDIKRTDLSNSQCNEERWYRQRRRRRGAKIPKAVVECEAQNQTSRHQDHQFENPDIN